MLRFKSLYNLLFLKQLKVEADVGQCIQEFLKLSELNQFQNLSEEESFDMGLAFIYVPIIK